MNLFIFIFFSTEFYQQETQFFSINVEISLDFNKVSNEKRSQKKNGFFLYHTRLQTAICDTYSPKVPFPIPSIPASARITIFY